MVYPTAIKSAMDIVGQIKEEATHLIQYGCQFMCVRCEAYISADRKNFENFYCDIGGEHVYFMRVIDMLPYPYTLHPKGVIIQIYSFKKGLFSNYFRIYVQSNGNIFMWLSLKKILT